MSTHDTAGIEWAKLSELKAGDHVKTDNGFTCLGHGVECVVHETTYGKFITCNEGVHYLEGQADDGEHLVGMYKV